MSGDLPAARVTVQLPNLERVECPGCRTVGQVRVEWRAEWLARELTTRVEWPWLVCGACGLEGRREVSS